MCEHFIEYVCHPIRSNSTKGKINEARVIDFSGIQRKEDVNEVSKLSKFACFAAPFLVVSPNGS